jgi:hypothetical protein
VAGVERFYLTLAFIELRMSQNTTERRASAYSTGNTVFSKMLYYSLQGNARFLTKCEKEHFLDAMQEVG